MNFKRFIQLFNYNNFDLTMRPPNAWRPLAPFDLKNTPFDLDFNIIIIIKFLQCAPPPNVKTEVYRAVRALGRGAIVKNLIKFKYYN